MFLGDFQKSQLHFFKYTIFTFDTFQPGWYQVDCCDVRSILLKVDLLRVVTAQEYLEYRLEKEHTLEAWLTKNILNERIQKPSRTLKHDPERILKRFYEL